ncbi:unnamed protein product [Pieris macdunnoughi]|uniref:Uncharacterized protein n=1 Tax=Pieris macdunnoughi TaxID=345717 RepID=A0A821WFK1_9NEOP|nr:unnamed protein product [Pieris macdunnoughi]
MSRSSVRSRRLVSLVQATALPPSACAAAETIPTLNTNFICTVLHTNKIEFGVRNSKNSKNVKTNKQFYNAKRATVFFALGTGLSADCRKLREKSIATPNLDAACGTWLKTDTPHPFPYYVTLLDRDGCIFHLSPLEHPSMDGQSCSPEN